MNVEVETVDCEGIDKVTDCISLEQWWTKKRQQERGWLCG